MLYAVVAWNCTLSDNSIFKLVFIAVLELLCVLAVNIFVYILMEDDDIKCAYFYRKTCVFYEKDLEILSCFASINGFDKYDKEGEKIFIHGFKISFWETCEKIYFGFAVVENIHQWR